MWFLSFTSILLLFFSNLSQADSRRSAFYSSQLQILDGQIKSLEDLILYEEKNLIAAYKTLKSMTNTNKFRESFGLRNVASGASQTTSSNNTSVTKSSPFTPVIQWAETYLFRRSTAGKLGGYAGTLVGLSDGETTDMADIAEFSLLFAKMDLMSIISELENIRKTLSISQKKLSEYRTYRERLLTEISRSS